MVRILASLAAAALYALALPPFGWTVLGWLTLVPLLLAVRDRSSRAAFGHGLLFGTAGCMAVAWWLPQAAVRYLELSWPLAILGLLAFAIVLTAPTVGLFAAGAAASRRALERLEQVRARVPAPGPCATPRIETFLTIIP